MRGLTYAFKFVFMAMNDEEVRKIIWGRVRHSSRTNVLNDVYANARMNVWVNVLDAVALNICDNLIENVVSQIVAHINER